jgi:hypothetical protein
MDAAPRLYRKPLFLLVVVVILTLGLLAGLGIIPSEPAPQVTKDTAK